MQLLEFAIEMEEQGAQYYREQAEKNRENSLYTVFNRLAEDERHHAGILKDKLNHLPYKPAGSVMPTAKNIFDGLGNFKMSTKSNPEQLDVYRLALEKEKQSIDLYQKLLNESNDDKDLFEFLIAQEEKHYEIMELLVKLVDRPNSWVESAEFGIREDY